MIENIKDTRVVLRLDLNVPVTDTGEIADDFRILEALPTVLQLQQQNNQIVILAHIEEGSLEKVGEYLSKKLVNFKFIKSIAADITPEELKMVPGDVVLLENVRKDPREKDKDETKRDELGKVYATFGEYFINEGFSVSHREHASITSIPKFLPCCLGPKFQNEIDKLSLALHPESPSLLIVGGAKFDTKLPMIEKFLNIVDRIFVGGALAHSFWKTRGQEIGKSLVDEEVKLSQTVLSSDKIILPIDVMNQDKKNLKLDEITKFDKITDFGESTFAEILNILDVTKTIIWNGPLDFYEAGYDWGTKMLIETLSKMQDKTIILGGGDTVTEINKVKQTNPNIKFTHVSTGGGAMIDFLSNGTLPGIDAVTKSQNNRI
jgi:phosphoglycerate kinase